MNIVFGTDDNHIGYIQIGPNPIRKNLIDGTWVKDGTNDDHDWIGLVKGYEKLRLIDPKKGYIVTANNMPGPKNYMNGLFTTSIITARADRIEELLKAKMTNKNLTTQDMMEVQLDTVDFFCRFFAQKDLANTLLPPGNLFEGFNCDFTKDSYQAAVYEVFFYQYYKLLRPTTIHNIAISHHFQQYMLRNIYFAKKGDQVSEVIVQAYDNAISSLEKMFNSEDPKTW